MARREALGKGIGALFSDQESEVKTPDSSVITNEPEVVSKESEIKTTDSPVNTSELEVVSKESEVITLGEKEKNQKQRSGNRGQKRQRPPATKTKQFIDPVGHTKLNSIDEEILEQAITEAQASPRISTWSPPVTSALRYLQLTTARFSMSKEVSETLEAAFKEKYPELYERIEKELEER